MIQSEIIHGEWPSVFPLAPGTVQLVLTDPPYGGVLETEAFADVMDCRTLLRDLRLYHELLEPGGSALIFGGIGRPLHRPFLDFLARAEQEVRGMQLRDLLTWRKRRAYGTADRYLFIREEIAWFVKASSHRPLEYRPRVFNVPLTSIKRGYAGYNSAHPAKSEFLRVGNVIDDVTEIFRGKRHPCEKPLELIRRLVRTHSEPGDLVFDPYAGSGTTAEACQLEGRSCVAIERELAAVGTARERVGLVGQSPSTVVDVRSMQGKEVAS